MSLHETDIKFGASGLDYYLSSSERTVIKTATPELLQQFSKVAENILVHQADRDLWQISDDGTYIQQMFDPDGTPLKMEAASEEQKTKNAAADKVAVNNEAKQIFLLLEDQAGRSIRTNEKVARVIFAMDSGNKFRYIKSSDPSIPDEKIFKILRKESVRDVVHNIQDFAQPSPKLSKDMKNDNKIKSLLERSRFQKVQKVSCPGCGIPVPMPQEWDGSNPEEALCNQCYEEQEKSLR
jgi:hypothetical protein